MLGETYVEELRLADVEGDGFKATRPGTGAGGTSANADGRGTTGQRVTQAGG